MPRVDLGDEMEEMRVPGPGTFTFSAVKPEHLGACEYTLVTILCDVSGSVTPYSVELLNTVKKIIDACKRSERSENLMVRFVTFQSNVEEVHGFKELNTIDVNGYRALDTGGMTALFDAAVSGIGAILTYSDSLLAQEFSVNGAVYIITDGEDNASSLGPAEVKRLMDDAVRGEKIESLITVLVGLTGDGRISSYLERFQRDAGLTQYVDVGEATSGKLAKLAEFVSQSISSQSNALAQKGSGSAHLTSVARMHF